MLKLWVDKNINMNKGAWDAFDYSATVAIEMHASSNKKKDHLDFSIQKIQFKQMLFFFTSEKSGFGIVVSQFHLNGY